MESSPDLEVSQRENKTDNDPLTPEQVAGAYFTTGRRGFDESEVREFLGYVAERYQGALGAATQASSQFAALRADYDKTLAAFRSAAAATQVAESALRDAQTRYQQAEGRAGSMERERDEALARVGETQRSLDLALSELEVSEAAVQRAPDALSGEALDVYSQVGDEVAGLLRHAAETADSVRAEAELYAAQTRREADDYGESQRQEAEADLSEATQRSVEVRAEADQYAEESRYQADIAAMRVEAAADQKASQTVSKATSEAAELVADAERDVAALRVIEVQLRESLEAIRDWIARSLKSPTADVPLEADTGSPPAT